MRGTLGSKPNVDSGTLPLAWDLYDREFAQSGFVRNTLALLEKVGGKEVLWISWSGNCPMKKCVTGLRGLISWMELEANECFRNRKTYREQDVGEPHLLRLSVGRVGLMRLGGLWFDLTQLSRATLEPGRWGRIQALLFLHGFRNMAFFRFVRTAPRGVLGSWVQGGFRVIQWDLPAVTEDWQSADTFTVLCTVPDDATSETRRRLACRMFAWRILSLLRWFGLHDYRRPQETLDVVWRMSALFDRFVWLEVTYSDSPGAVH